MTMFFLGSCGLHVINVALKTGYGAVKWKVQLLLCSSYKLFSESHAHLADYIVGLGVSSFQKSSAQFNGLRMLTSVRQH